MIKKAIGIVIKNDKNEILLIKKGKISRDEVDSWDIVTGEIDPKETPREAAIRECLEETGTQLTIVRELFTEQVTTNGEKWDTTIFEGKITGSPSIQNKDECSDIGWFSKEALKTIPLSSYLKADLEKLSQIKLKIHFVCTGNTFRSRLAEAYLKSKQLPNLIVTSSGVEASKNLNGPITWYTQKVMEEKRLVDYKSKSWTQTTKTILEDQDLVIFMKKWHYEVCKEKFGFRGESFDLWNIEDIKTPTGMPDSRTIKKAREIYGNITKKVGGLLEKLKTETLPSRITRQLKYL